MPGTIFSYNTHEIDISILSDEVHFLEMKANVYSESITDRKYVMKDGTYYNTNPSKAILFHIFLI